MSRLKVAAVIGAVAVAAAACSSGKSGNDHGATGSPTSSVQPSASTPAALASAGRTGAGVAAGRRSAASASTLSGTWHGRYDGSYSGTFVLVWQQSGASLDGTIALSAPGATVPIHGAVSGGTIQFGTVGSYAITYNGTVSAGGMSGRFDVAGAASGSGTWTATKA